MQSIERHIISALIRNMNDEGYLVAAFWDGEEYQMGGGLPGQPVVSHGAEDPPDNIVRAMGETEALDAIDTVDEGTLHFTHRNKDTWGTRGVYLVLGNGEDVISDYHVAEGEPFGKVIKAIYDRISDGKLL